VTSNHHKSQQQDLTFIAESIALLLQKQTSQTVLSASDRGLNTGGHTATLTTKSQELAPTVPNPTERFKIDRSAESTIFQALTDLERANRERLTAAPNVSTQYVRAAPWRLTTIRNKKRNRMRFECVFGVIDFLTITWNSTRYDEDQNLLEDNTAQYNSETSFTVHPSRWVQLCGINYGIQVTFSKSLTGLQWRLRTHRAVPDDAEIFEACRRGDVDAVRLLFDERQASPLDTNSRGFMPLFVSPSLSITIWESLCCTFVGWFRSRTSGVQ